MSEIKSNEVSKNAEISKSTLNDLLSVALKSLCLTRDYVGEEILPAIDG